MFSPRSTDWIFLTALSFQLLCFKMDALSAPFVVFRPPNLKLKIPKIEQPSAMTVFAVLLASYFLVISGIIYDVIVEPPSIGSVQDERTGSVKPVVFLQWRVNGQYIIEGLSAGTSSIFLNERISFLCWCNWIYCSRQSKSKIYFSKKPLVITPFWIIMYSCFIQFKYCFLENESARYLIHYIW